MRPILLSLCLAALAAPTLAAEPWPKFKKHTPYPTVRARLIRMGIEPVPVRAKPGHLVHYQAVLRRAYPELVDCSAMGLQGCLFLFRRRSDARLVMIVTAGEALDFVTPPDLSTVQYMELRVPDADDLEDVIVSGAARAGPRRGP